MNSAIINIKTNDRDAAVKAAEKYRNIGFIIKNAYFKRSFFGRPTYYFIEMEQGEINYTEEIEKALQEERYEDVDKLQKEYENQGAIFKKTFDAKIKQHRKKIKQMFSNLFKV